MVTKENITEESLKLLPGFKMALLRERENILNRWIKYGLDKEQGGFYQIIDTQDRPDPFIPKSSLTVAALLYNFSSAYLQTKDENQIAIADRAFRYLKNFRDTTNGGVYNTIKGNTEPLDANKNTRTQATVISAICAYHACQPNDAVKDIAIAIYQRILRQAKDSEHGGFFELFNREWESKKSESGMEKNGYTQVVILEAFADLYAIWPDENLQHEMYELLELILDKIIKENFNYLQVEFTKDWKVISNYVLFAFDLETIRALQEVARIIKDAEMTDRLNYTCVKIAHTASMGIDKDGGIWKQYFFEGHRVIKEKQGWAQVCALLAFFQAWILSDDDKFLQQSLHSYHFIHSRMIHPENGNWLIAVDESYQEIDTSNPELLTKYPMHNFRALNDTLKLIDTLL